MSEEELDKSVEDQKSINTSRSTQFALRTWQTWLEQSEFAEAEKKSIEVYMKQELSFPGFWNIFIGRYIQQMDTNLNFLPHLSVFSLQATRYNAC